MPYSNVQVNRSWAVWQTHKVGYFSTTLEATGALSLKYKKSDSFHGSNYFGCRDSLRG